MVKRLLIKICLFMRSNSSFMCHRLCVPVQIESLLFFSWSRAPRSTTSFPALSAHDDSFYAFFKFLPVGDPRRENRLQTTFRARCYKQGHVRQHVFLHFGPVIFLPRKQTRAAVKPTATVPGER